MGAERVVDGLRLAALVLVVAGCGAGTASDASAQAEERSSRHHGYRVATVASGLEHAWGLAFLPGGDMLVTERGGRLRLVSGGALDPRPIEGVPAVRTGGQGGLLDVAVHPDFASNRLVYLSYSKPGPRGATTAVSRGRLEGHRLADVEEIFEAQAWSTSSVHFGSRLVFDGEGHLFVTVGERGRMQNAQDLSTHAGKVIRLHDDGRVPADNPFVGRADALPEIWAYGVRSPQGLVRGPDGRLWESEHGPRGGDEVNIIRPGANYGWPVITYGINYNGRPITDITEKEGMMQPLHYWVPSIATSGIAIYTGDRFPRWRGDVFVGGLAGQQLARVRFEDDRPVETEVLLEEVGRRIRDVRDGPDGYLYVLTDESSGSLLRLEPVS